LNSNDPQSYVDLIHDPSFQVFNDVNSIVGGPTIDLLALNTTKTPLDDIRIRQAIAYSIDRQSLRKVFENDVAKIVDSLFVPGDPYYTPVDWPDFDVNKASQLVQSYVAEKGPLRSLQISGPQTGRYAAFMEALQPMLAAAGIQTTVSENEDTTYVLDVVQGNFDIGIYELGYGPDPDYIYIYCSTTTVAPIGQVSLNIARFSDPTLQGYLVQGRSDPDPNARILAYQNVAKELAVQLPYLCMWQTVNVCAADNKTMNFRSLTCPDGSAAYVDPGGSLWATQMWLNA
jgi:peptide/nickel transport system substrate-binding protein